ncbi:MAG: alpha/beta fold hydrolase [Actinomycetota bacterium]|nr:alpha/beta fold hydrolase [Actinomycetota bacterium]
MTFTSDGGRVSAWLYPPADRRRVPGPCVVMAHGFSLTRHDGLAPFAEHLAGAGATVVVFDHRFLGDSPGEPRQRFRRSAQRADWRNAVAFARTLPEVDPARVALWGFSFSGGLAVETAAADDRIAALMLLCPFLDGPARIRSTPLPLVAWILPRALADRAGRHNLIPVTGPPGTHVAMSLPGEAEGFAATVPGGSPWRNEISPGLFATVVLHRPWAKAGRLTMPVWVGQGDQDISVSAGAIGKLVAGAGGAELHRYPVDHFGPFRPAMTERIAGDQAAFFVRRVLAPAG